MLALGILPGDIVCFEPRTVVTPSGFIKSRFLDDKLRKRVLDLSPFVFINYREQAFASSNKMEGFVNLPGVVTYNSGLTLEDTYVTE